MKPLNPIATGFGESVFTTLTRLANQAGAINLAQGFPDFDGPEWIKELAIDAVKTGPHQYAPSMGAISLRQGLADFYLEQYKLSLDPAQEILVTVGASEAIYSTIVALLAPGEELLCFEPLYDSYLASAQLHGVKICPVTLPFPGLEIDWDRMEDLCGPKTKALILNNPHNPTGKVFSQAELEKLALFAQKHDLYVICDEVYEFLTFETPHIPLASLPGMRQRVVTISSMGKTLSLTGWKIGWAMGPHELIKPIHHVHQFITFCLAHPLQIALANTLPRLKTYLPEFRAQYFKKRDYLIQGLTSLGFKPQRPQGTYFLLAQVPNGQTDVSFSQELIHTKKVAALPLSSFYLESNQGTQLIRFCFAKKMETLSLALNQLRGGL